MMLFRLSKQKLRCADELTEEEAPAVRPQSKRIDLASCSGSTVVALPCGHAFHFSCIMHWLRQCRMAGRRAVCPMCQAPVAVQTQLTWRLWFEQARLAGGQDPLLEGLARLDNEAHLPPIGADHIRVNFLNGFMPQSHMLHLQHHPHAPPPHQEVPFVVRWRHTPTPVALAPASKVPPPPSADTGNEEQARMRQHEEHHEGHRNVSCIRNAAGSFGHGRTNVDG